MSTAPLAYEAVPAPGVAGVTRLVPVPDLPERGARHDSAQGTLALALEGAPPPDLRLVRGTGLRDVEAWAARFVMAVMEVMAGDRNPHQLLRSTSYDVQTALVERSAALNAVARPGQRRRALRPHVRSVHVQQVRPDAVEVSAHVRDGQRSRAVACRLELQAGRWTCVALQLG